MTDALWYSCEVRHYSVADEWGDHAYSTAKVVWRTYREVATTTKGVWVADCLGYRHFILGKAKRQLACPTKELALADAIARKRRHIAGCAARLASAEADLSLLLTESTKQW